MPTPLFVRAAVWLWLLSAVYLGHARVLTTEPAHIHVLSVLLPAVIVVVGGLFLGQVRGWFDELDLRMLVFLHTTRLLAIFYLVLHGRGQLPGEFALTVAWGEIAIAVAALVLGVLPLRRSTRLRAIGIWNIVGLVTAIIGLVTAARLAFGGDLRLLVFTELPFNLVPTFLAPLVLASHVLLYRRLQREARAPAGTDEPDSH
jgi:hypothetical protein